MCHKSKFKFQGYKNCLEATQTENKINHAEKLAINSWPSIHNTNIFRFWIRKTNALLNLTNHESDIDKTYLKIDVNQNINC